MNVIDQLEIFKKEIYDLYEKGDKKKDDLINWARTNKSEIKKHFPIKEKIYQIINPGSAFGLEKNDKTFYYRSNYYSINTKFYFKVTNTSFNPGHDFTKFYHCIRMPSVKGIILNEEFNKLFDYEYEEEIEITYLKKVNDEVLSDKPTFIYVMIDKNTGYYKIGKSVDPKHRERTLQSEKPTIEMLYVFSAKSSDEKKLHEIFKQKRIRGEWFDLSGTRINQILDEINWPASQRDIDTGLTTLQADPGTNRTALQALFTVAESEYGAIYVDADNNFVFQDRSVTVASIAGTPTLFADNGSGIDYFDATWILNDVLVFNKATITRVGGTGQVATNQASDQADNDFRHVIESQGRYRCGFGYA